MIKGGVVMLPPSFFTATLSVRRRETDFVFRASLFWGVSI